MSAIEKLIEQYILIGKTPQERQSRQSSVYEARTELAELRKDGERLNTAMIMLVQKHPNVYDELFKPWEYPNIRAAIDSLQKDRERLDSDMILLNDTLYTKQDLRAAIDAAKEATRDE